MTVATDQVDRPVDGEATPSAGRPRRRLSRRARMRMVVAGLVGPILIYEGVFILWPIVSGALMSFRDTRLGGQSGDFVGFAQYERLFSDPNFANSLAVTLVYALSVVVLAVGFGLVTALLVNRRFPGRGLVRGMMTAPWAFPEIATVLVFVWIFNPSFGVINLLRPLMPWWDFGAGWLTSTPLSLISIVLISTWKNFPFYSIVILSSLQTVPEDLHEAAIVDGAGALHRFRHVTLPAITPTLTLLSLLAFVFSFRQFTLIWLTTGGGPARSTETLVVSIYTNSFRFFEFSYGAAIGVTCLLVTLVATVLFALAQRRIDRMEG